jgi:hypothetical protein
MCVWVCVRVCVFHSTQSENSGGLLNTEAVCFLRAFSVVNTYTYTRCGRNFDFTSSTTFTILRLHGHERSVTYHAATHGKCKPAVDTEHVMLLKLSARNSDEK